MKSSFELLCNLTFVVMNSDEQFSDNVDKQMLNQQVNENVTVLTQNKIQKGHLFRWPFFMSALKIFNEVFNECSMKKFQLVSKYANYPIQHEQQNVP